MAVYPRVKTAVIFVVCSVLVAGTAAYVNLGKFRSAGKKEKVVTALAETNQPLPDDNRWKETFFSINDSASSTRIGNSVQSRDISGENLTATDVFGRDFFSRFISLKQAGLASDPEAGNSLASQIVEDGLLITEKPRVYTERDILISSDETVAFIRSYGNAIGRILIENTPKNNETVIVKQALEEDSPELLAEIDPIIQSYKIIISSLERTTVPRSAREQHIELINTISMILTNANSLKNAFTDPLRALSAVSEYQNVESDFFYAISSLRSYFSEKGITFTQIEPAFPIFSSK